MPIINPPNCREKIGLAITMTIIVVILSLYLFVNFIGLMGVFFIFPLTIVLSVWIMDIYGDAIFTDKEYMISKENINKMKDKKIPENIINDIHQLNISK
jgi:hypothetical protein